MFRYQQWHPYGKDTTIKARALMSMDNNQHGNNRSWVNYGMHGAGSTRNINGPIRPSRLHEEKRWPPPRERIMISKLENAPAVSRPCSNQLGNNSVGTNYLKQRYNNYWKCSSSRDSCFKPSNFIPNHLLQQVINY